MTKMTLEQALTIQAEQCAHYERFAPGITEIVADHTNTTGLSHAGLYDVSFLNTRIPRGGYIEKLAGMYQDCQD